MANRKQQRSTSNPNYSQDPVLAVINGYPQDHGTPALRTGRDEWTQPRVVTLQEYVTLGKQPKQ